MDLAEDDEQQALHAAAPIPGGRASSGPPSSCGTRFRGSGVPTGCSTARRTWSACGCS
jgi:hypothetical protein